MLGPGRWRGRWDARPRHTPEATARTGLARPPGTVAFWPAARHGRQNGRRSAKSQLRKSGRAGAAVRQASAANEDGAPGAGRRAPLPGAVAAQGRFGEAARASRAHGGLAGAGDGAVPLPAAAAGDAGALRTGAQGGAAACASPRPAAPSVFDKSKPCAPGPGRLPRGRLSAPSVRRLREPVQPPNAEARATSALLAPSTGRRSACQPCG